MRTISNTIEVAQEYRKNPLSLKPGGVRVAVIMKSGLKKIYNRVKFPEKYARAIHGNDISEIIILD
jgi:hypothetical protein